MIRYLTSMRYLVFSVFVFFIVTTVQGQNLTNIFVEYPTTIIAGETAEIIVEGNCTFPSSSDLFDEVNLGTITPLQGNTWSYTAPSLADPGFDLTDFPLYDTLYVEKGTTYDTAIVEVLLNQPGIYDVMEDGSYCELSGPDGSEVWLTDSDNKEIYILYKDGNPFDTIKGDGDSISFGLQLAGEYTIRSQKGDEWMNGSAVISEIPQDASGFIYLTDSTYCEGGPGVEFGLDTSRVGVDYILYNSIYDSLTTFSGTGGSLSLGYYTDSSGYYTVEATSGECSVVLDDSLDIAIKKSPISYSFTGPDNFCEGDSVELVVEGSEEDIEYNLIDLNTGTTDTTVYGDGNPLYFTVSDSGTYYVMGTDTASLCSKPMKDTLTVDMYPSVNMTVSPDSTGICNGDSVQLNASGADSYVWEPNTGLSDDSIADPVAGPTSTQDYEVIGNNSYNCPDKDTVTVTVNPNPTANAGSDTSICEGDTAELDAGVVDGASYSWNPSSNLTSPDSRETDAFPSTSTNYTVTVTSAEGCSAKDTVSVQVDSVPAPAVNDPSVCYGDTVALNASGGNYYEWSNDSTGSSIDVSPDDTSTFFVEAFYTNGCSAKDTSTVSVMPLPTLTTSNDTTICPGSSVELGASASGGSGSYSYEWSTGQSGDSITVSPSSEQDYGVEVTDDNRGCSSTDTINVSLHSLPDISVSGLNNSYCNDREKVDFSATPSDGSFTDPWDSTAIFEDLGSGEAVFYPSNVPSEGTYDITYEAANSNGCVDDTTFSFTINFVPDVNFSGLSDTVCKSAPEDTLYGNPQNSNGSFYGAGITNNGDGTAIFDPSSVAGEDDHTIIYEYTDTTTGCSNTDSQDVFVQHSPSRYTVNVENGYYCEQTAGDSIYLSGGEANTLYEVVKDSTSIVYDTTLASGGGFTFAEAFTEGTYIVVATSPNGCVDTMQNAVSTYMRELPSDAQPISGDDTVIVGGIGYYSVPPISNINSDSYNWIKPTNATIDSGNGTRSIKMNFSGVASGDQTIGVFGSNSCGNGDTAYFDVYVLPEPASVDSIAGDSTVCAGSQSLVYEAFPELSEADSIEWTLPSGFTIVSGRGTERIKVDVDSTSYSSGDIIARGVNESGTGEADSLRVTVNPIPTIDDVSISDVLDCAVDSVLIIGRATPSDASYTWTGGGKTVNDDSVYATSPEEYTLTVNADGCTAYDTVTVQENTTQPSASIPTPDTLTCSDNTVQLEVNTDASNPEYLWTTSGGNIVSGDSTSNPTVNSDGSYTVTVTNTANSCSTQTSTTVEENTAVPNFTLSDSVRITCSKDTAEITASSVPDASYSWSPSSGILNGQGTTSITVNQTGTYSLTVTKDNNGCSQTKSRTVEADSSKPQAVDLTKTGDITCDEPQVSLEATTTTSNVSYNFYELTSGNVVSQSGNTALVDQQDQYAVTITKNATGCTAEDTITVNENTSTPTVNIDVSSTEITCSEPEATLEVTSSLTDRVVQWNATNGGNIISGATDPQATVNSDGDYTAVVTDTITGCSNTETVTITNNLNPPAISGITRSPDSLTCTNDVTLMADVSGYSALEWTGPGNITPNDEDTVTVDEAGTYKFTATAPNGCKDSAYVDVPADTSSPKMVLTTDYDDITCNNTHDTLEVSSSTPNVTYQWSKVSGSGTITNTNSQNPVVDGEGTYEIVITGDNGCTNVDQVSVDTNYTKPVISSFDHDPDSISCKNDWVELLGESSTTDADLLWSTSGTGTILDENTSTPRVDQAGTYTLSVTNPETGCIRQDSVEVHNNFAEPEAIVDQNVEQITCAVDTVRLDGSASTGVNFKWTAKNGSDFQPNDTVEQPYVTSGGEYILTVEHPTSGCTDSASVEVEESQDVPYIGLGYNEDTLTCNQTQITLTVDSVDVPDYWWTTSDGNIVSGDSTLDATIDEPGTYTFHAIDSVTGCTNSKSEIIEEDTQKPNVTASSDTLTCTVDTVHIDSRVEYTTDLTKVSYEWTAGAGGNIVPGDENRPNPRVTASANYELTLTDDVNGCKTTISHFVERNTSKPDINIDKDPNDITCARSAVTLEDNTDQTDVTYEWSTTGSGNIGNKFTPTPTVDAAGWYTLRITKNNTGCYVEDSVQVDTNYTTPTVFIDPVNDITCSNPEVELSGGSSTDSVSYKWTGPGITGDPTSPLTYADEGGDYKLTVTSKESGCKNDSSVHVVENTDVPDAPALSSASSCEDSSTVALTATTGSNIRWYSDAGLTNLVETGSSYTPPVTAPGDYVYYATQTGSNGCVSDPASVIYTVHSSPAKPTAADTSICYGEPNPFMDAYPSNSNYDIHWYNTSDSLLSESDSYQPEDSAIGTYEYRVTQVDLNGCESPQESAYFTVKDTLSAPVVEKDTLRVCENSDPKSFVAHGSNIQWYNITPPASSIATGNVFTPEDDTPGTYTYYVTQSGNDCESDFVELTYIVLEAPAEYNLYGGGTYCEGTGGVEIGLDNSDANDTYELRRDGNAFITSVSGTGDTLSFGNITSEGTFTVYATADNGCVERMNETVVVDEEPLPEDAGTIVGDSVVCEGASVDYSVPEIDYATDYVWDLPSGANIEAGSNSNTITVSYSDSAQDGMITVYGANSCGEGGTSVGHAIDVTLLPDSAEAITGPDQICQGENGVTFEVPQIADADEYVWSIPSGATIASGEGSRQIIVDFTESFNGGIIKVHGENSCGSGVSSPDHTIDVNDKPIIVTDSYKSVCTSSDSLIVDDPGGGVTVLWELIDGQGNINDESSFETEVTNLGTGINKFEVTLSNGTCADVDTVTIENNQLFVNAGSDETLCEDSTQLSGSVPDDEVTGTWSAVEGSANFSDANDPKTDITDIAKGKNVFRWKQSKNGCESDDSVTIINNSPTEADAGISRGICGDSTNLNANVTGAEEIGEWSINNGYVDFGNENDPKTKITEVAKGENTLTWTIDKYDCSSSDQVKITNNQVEVEAGEDQIICTYTTSMDATPAPSGTSGHWEVASGSADIIDPESPTSDVYLLLEDTTVLNWVVDKDGCYSRDGVMIINDSPSNADAGDDQVIYQSSTYMDAADPDKGSGEWSLLSGGGDIEDNTDPKTEVTNMAYGESKFQWIVTHNGCTSLDTITIDNQADSGVDAGNDTTVCQDNIRLSASEPVQGEGEWSVVTGSANFENINDPETKVSGLSRGENELRWTVYGTGVVSDEVVITNNAPTSSNAGPDMTYCTDSTQLSANNPTVGEGEWSTIGGSGTFDDSSKNNTMVRELATGNNTLRWTITNENCESTDDVVVTNDKPTEADAGQDQTLCSDEAVLYGNSPAIGEGLWTLVSGSNSVTFQDQTVGNTVVENLGNGDNVLRWTITNGNCSSSDDVVITNDNPTEPNAGRNKSICTDSFRLSANEITIGKSSWEVISGYGEFEDSSQHNTMVRSLAKGNNILRWTAENNDCVLQDEVEISNDLVDADAGISQSICVDSTTLSANNPAPGIGYWSVVAGSASFDDPNQSDTDVSGLDHQVTNILKWTIANEGCVSSDTMTVDNNHPGIIYAGQDKEVCGSNVTLKANPNYLGEGEWTSLTGGGVIHDSDSSVTQVSDLSLGNNTFRWTIRRNGCVYSDEVTIYNNSPVEAYAGENDSTCSSSYTLHAEEPPFGRGKWTVVAGSGEFENDTSYTTTVNNMAQGANTYKWTLYNGSCSTSDEVTIVVNKPDAPLAGPDKTVCSDSTQLQGNHHDDDQTGYWEIVEGSANFEDETDPKTKVTGLNYGKNTLRWNIEKNGCVLSDEVTITNNSPTVAFAGDNMHVCGDETNLNAEEPSIGTGEWSLVSGTATFEDKTSPSTLVTDLSYGPNTLRWKTSYNGCTSTDDVIIYNDQATAYAGEDQETYEPSAYLVGNSPKRGEGQWVVLGGSGTFEHPDSAQTMVWDLSPGVNTFRWKITNNSCIAFDEVSITYYEMPEVEFTVDTNSGCPPLEVQFLNKSLSSVSEFEWDFGDNNISTHENPRHTYYEPGEYEVELSTTGPDGSLVTEDTTIIVHEEPEADFEVSPNELYIPEQHLQAYNMSVDADRFLWHFGDDSTSDQEGPRHTYQDTGTYDIGLEVWSKYNCYDSIVKPNLVTVEQSGKIKFPSGFTPNTGGPVGGHYDENDRSNDVFHPIVKGVSEYHLEIFNRWGVMVFQSNRVEIGWDGYFKGELAPEGVYIYKVNGRYNNGRSFEKTGNFILIRK